MVEPDSTRSEILRRLGDVPLIDGHNDIPWQIRERCEGDVDSFGFEDTSAQDPPIHTDIRRLRAGGVGAQFWAAYVPVEAAGPGASRVMFEQIDTVHELVRRHSSDLELATGADDIERIHDGGRIACLIGVEGGHAIEGSVGLLRCAYRAGARYLTLTHNAHTEWADSATEDPRHGGLTDAGREVVVEMNRLGMMIDLSHASPDTMHDVLDASRAPVIFSHSGARAITDHPRNVPDDVLERVRNGGGLVMATFVPAFVSERARRHRAAREAEEARLRSLLPADPEGRERRLEAWKETHPGTPASLVDVADHVDHLRDVMGIEHVGIGSDFDGIQEVPDGLEDASRYPALLWELAHRGYGDAELQAIAGANILRVMRQVEESAGKAARPGS